MASVNEKEELSAYLSSSPPPFCPQGRVTDKDAIVQIIDSAKRYAWQYVQIEIWQHKYYMGQGQLSQLFFFSSYSFT